MTRPFQLTLLAAIGIAAVSAAVAIERPRAVQITRGCLVIGEGVCLSGTAAWVADASVAAHQQGIMLAMAGDEY